KRYCNDLGASLNTSRSNPIDANPATRITPATPPSTQRSDDFPHPCFRVNSQIPATTIPTANPTQAVRPLVKTRQYKTKIAANPIPHAPRDPRAVVPQANSTHNPIAKKPASVLASANVAKGSLLCRN